MAVKSTSQATEFHVHPTGWDSSPESERFSLSLMGHIMPKIYVLIAEVFLLPDGSDIDAISKSMTAGLEFALSQNPILTGTLSVDAETGQMWVQKERDSTVSLHIKHVLEDDEFASYEELYQKDFPSSLMDGNKLLPRSVTAKQLLSPLGNNDEEGIPVAVFQLNFIRGGLILALAVHHALSDGPGCEGFLTTWAENSAAAAVGEPFVLIKDPFVLEGSPHDVQKPAPSEKISDTNVLIRDAGGPMPPPPAGFVMPPLANQMWHFPKSRAAQLKERASSEIKDGWISTYDAILALLWGSVTRAKLDLLKLDLNTEAIVIHAVDTRRIFNPPLPEHFLGNGACAGRVEPYTLKDVINPANHSKLATAVRASIKAVTPEHITGLLKWVASREDKRYLEHSVNPFLGPDFATSSWAGMQPYDKHDFGFGYPKALRWPSPQFEGFAFIYPSRAAQKYPSEDEGVELVICLEENCMQRLLKDEELLKYAHPRG